MEKLRLVNNKTRLETGFDFVLSKLSLGTPFGKRIQKEGEPYYPGQEEELSREFDRIESLIAFAKTAPRNVDKLHEVFSCIKDITGSIKRAGTDTLSTLEIYEVKSLLLYMLEIKGLTHDSEFAKMIPEEFYLDTIKGLLDILDPRGDRINTFYIYDEYSKALQTARAKKKDLEVDIRKAQKAAAEAIRKEYGISLTPKFDIVIPKTSDKCRVAKEISELEQIAEDYSSATFVLVMPKDAIDLAEEREALNATIEEEEYAVRQKLSKSISEYQDKLIDNCERLGRLDFVLAKALMAMERGCIRPEIVDEHIVEIEDGRQMQVEDILSSQGKDYCPISMKLAQGVSCITGANMGGKTVSLKLSGLIPIMAQYGYFVPCKSAKIGLSNYIRILVGDSQSLERGLSSFGSEMEELKEMLDQAKDRSILLVDEIASGTNPVEGLALTKSIVDYLTEKPYITLLTTHFETVTNDDRVRNMQVRGLADADFRKLNSELSGANRRQRIDIIGKYMDYRLIPVEPGQEVPKDAINIARMLGLPDEIIQGALDSLVTGD